MICNLLIDFPSQNYQKWATYKLELFQFSVQYKAKLLATCLGKPFSSYLILKIVLL